MQALPIGKAQLLSQGIDVAILAFGSMVATAQTIGQEINATVVNMRFILPLDEDLIKQAARAHEILITLEENTISGGAGSAINECLHRLGLQNRVLNIGLPQNYADHGERGELLADCQLDESGVRKQINQFLDTSSPLQSTEKLSVTQ